MKKKTKSNLINLGIIIIIALIVVLSISSKPASQTTEKIAQCIGENSIFYTQLGCSHCEDQKELFGENSQYLTIIDCFYEPDECGEIEGTPTWEIKGKLYTGVLKINKLQELTEC